MGSLSDSIALSEGIKANIEAEERKKEQLGEGEC